MNSSRSKAVQKGEDLVGVENNLVLQPGNHDRIGSGPKYGSCSALRSPGSREAAASCSSVFLWLLMSSTTAM